jgi:ADP-ribosyl-[dinitrogen reductase] hydrolase
MSNAKLLEAGVLGLLIGDALGVPYEFHKSREIPPVEQIEYQPPDGFVRAHAGVPPGTWSDDGAQALCLLDSLLELGHFDPADLAQRLLRWYSDGYMAVDANVFDIGITTARALRTIKLGRTHPLDAGPDGSYDNGNGALMRVLPLALWHEGTDKELVRDAHLQSRITHGHLRSQDCCALYCLWARNIVAGAPQPWEAAVASIREIYKCEPGATEELEWNLRPDDPPAGTGSGYVVDSIRSARWALEQGSYEQVVKAAISLGNDTDTTACIAGGLAAIRDGADAIPQRWLDGLRGREILDPLLSRIRQSV